MSDVRTVSETDIIGAIGNVCLSVQKVDDAKCLLELIQRDFFDEYDPQNREHRDFIAYYFDSFASYARALDVCLRDLHNTLSKADDVLFNVRASDVISAVSNDVAEKTGGGDDVY